MLLQTIEKWFLKSKPNMYKYEDGFYEVTYLTNSPQATVESLAKVPFRTQDKKAQTITSTLQNNYASSVVHYQEIEEGLWIISVDVKFDNNIRFKLTTDKNIPANYYLLICQISKLPYIANKPSLEELTYDYKSWALIKPGKAINVNQFKNTHVVSYHIYFSEAWFKKNILPIESLRKNELSSFLASNRDYIIWPSAETNVEPIFDATWQTIQQKGSQGVANPLELKIHTLNLINSFLTQLVDKEKYKRYFNIEDEDRKIALQAERIIIENLLTDFPSIESIAKHLHISPSKLKSIFKTNFGMPMHKYYLAKKMAYAKELLLKDNVLIKDIAYKVGYENVSKFSATFKKHYDCLPSEVYHQKGEFFYLKHKYNL
ncbi:MAG TPA: AraC family transcriptional regulator [Bacteroidia bacterium]|jgi:AraC-like DNA-binding protein|nr:AraC family transcriptional regulator [Bacteroidia bacterium]